MKTWRSRICLPVLVALVALCAGEPARAQEPSPPVASEVTTPAPIPSPPADASHKDAQAAPVSEASQPPQPARAIPRELSPWSMFLSADVFVKGVMISLVFASLMTWTILLAKLGELALARRRVNAALHRIGNARSLAEAQAGLGAQGSVVAAFVAAALSELRLSEGRFVESGIKERVASRFSEIVKTEARAVRRGMSLLATIGSTAPFVGLFGTVWGIMNSFIGISKAQTTNLAVVAPGIAEALLATAIGLAAAIPAVIIYNFFNRRTRGYLDLIGSASGAVGRLLSRDLDRPLDRSSGALLRAAE
jgi:biopolymer transport protein ExbB